MTFSVDFRIKEAKERAAFPELYPAYEPPPTHVQAKWNLDDTLLAIDRAEAVQRRGYAAMSDSLILAVLCGRTPDEARAAAQAYYRERTNIMEDAIQRFRLSVAGYETAQALHEDSRLDVLLAERGKAEMSVEDAKAAHSKSSTEVWYPAYAERRDAAAALLDAIGLTENQVEHFKGAIR